MTKPSDSSVQVRTFGCRVNTYESERMRLAGESAGLSDLPGGAILFNTCAVTSRAVSESKRAIRRARREHPEARIIVSGCAAQTEPDTFSEMQEVDLVLGNEEKLHSRFYRHLPDFGVNDFEKVRINELSSVRETTPFMLDAIDDHTRAFVQVQNGCDHRCTFCIIPYARGVSRSVPMGMVVDQVKRLVSNGYGEVVLTGIDLTSWGSDLPTSDSLGRLVRSILDRVPDLRRLRLSSIDSIEIDDCLFESLAYDSRLMPYLHLSLQSGDDMILKRMRRRHSRSESIEFCDRLRSVRPEIIFGADIIAGFPTETESMFENSLSLIEHAGLTHLHIFPFSPRSGTPASRMPQVPGSTIHERASRLRELGLCRLDNFLRSRVGCVESVLMESNGIGRTEQFTPVSVEGLASGEFADILIHSYGSGRLFGVLESL